MIDARRSETQKELEDQTQKVSRRGEGESGRNK